MAEAAADCANDGLFPMLATARTNAINDFISDVQVAIAKNQKKANNNFVGSIGKRKFTSTDTTVISKNYYGIALYPKPTKNGVLKIERVGLCMDTTATYQCRIYSSLTTVSVHSFTIACVANVLTFSATLNYELPMYDGGEVEYYLVAEQTSARALTNAIACCGFSPNCTQWGNEYQADRMWYNSLMVGGIQADTHQEMKDAMANSNVMNGFVVECQVTCDSKQVICDNLDYLGNPNALLIASTVRDKTVYYALNMILNSQNINSAVLMNRETMANNAVLAAQYYTEKVAHLGTVIDVSQSGCYTCESKINIVTALI
jgi:hypothetical protein